MKTKWMAGIFAVLPIFAQTAPAQTIWNGTGDWVNTPANWSAGVPTSGELSDITSGTVTVSTNNAVGGLVVNAAQINIASGGVLTSSSFTDSSVTGVNIEAGGSLVVAGQFEESSRSVLTLGNGITFTPGSFVLAGATTFPAIVTVNGTDSATIGTVISNLFPSSDILLKNGSGTLILNQADTYSGGTTIAAGVVQAQNNSALGTGTVTIDSGATLDLSNGTTGVTVANAITISGSGSSSQGAIEASSPGPQITDLTVTGTVTLAANASVGSDNVNTQLDLYAIHLQTNTLTTVGAGRVNFHDTISGTGGLTVDSQVYITGGQNSYSGLTDVESGGDLNLQNQQGVSVSGNLTIESGGAVYDYDGNQLAGTTVLTINSGGQFVITGSDFTQGTLETIAGLQGTSTSAQLTDQSNSFGSETDTLMLAGSGSYTFAGVISDFGFPPLEVVKTGAGTQEIDGNNSYGGGTTLENGTLIAGNTYALGSGPVSITGGTLKLGNGVHTLMASAYSQTGGTLELAVAGSLSSISSHDELEIPNNTSSQVTLGSTLAINLSNLTGAPVPPGTTVSDTLTVVNTNAGYTGTFSSLELLSGSAGITGSLTYAGDDVDLILSQSSALFAMVGLTSNQQAILIPINAGIVAGNSNPRFAAFINALTANGATPAALGSALSQLSPQAFGQFTGETAFNNASYAIQSMDSYLACQRVGPGGTFVVGNGGIDTSALTVNDPSYDPNLAGVHSRLLAWSPAPYGHGLLSDSPGPYLGGIDLKEAKPAPVPPPGDPWNFFVRGNVILAQGFSNADVSHFDDNTESVAIGADYRLTPNFLVGVSAGFGHTDATLDDNGSSATVDSYSPGIYASYADHGWYADFVGDYVHNAYTQSRVIGFLDQTANSAPEGDEGVANLDGGYDFHLGGWTVGPLAGLQYTHLTVNGYNEAGSDADLSVGEQQSDSLRSRLGGNVSYSLAHDGVTFTPHLNASWQHEFMDQSRGISSQFDGLGLGSFNVRTDNPSRDSALVDAGLDAELNRTVTVFADYTVQAGASNYFGQSVEAGVKVGF